tara:strand:- start:16125 stop:17540 length:1416 start_codon:yes stop_codon:yes gene_type:complete
MKKELNIFLAESDLAPYHIHSPGNILANINLMVLGQLIKSKDGFELEPDILEKFYYDFNTDTYLLKLRKGLVFHNGRKATSKDLEFSLVRGFYSSDRSFFHTYLGNILGVRRIKKGDTFVSGAIEGIKVIDELTLKVKLVGPNPSFFHSLTAPYFSLVPREELKNDYLSWKDVPIGVGNYKVKSGFDGTKTVLEGYKKNAAFEIVTLYSKLKDNVSYDISFERINDYKTYYSRLPICVRLLEFSNKHPLSQDKRFKLVIKELIRQVDFEDNTKLATKTSDLLPSHFWGRVENNDKKFDLEKNLKELELKKLDVIVYSGSKLNDKHLFYISKLKKLFKKYKIELNFIPNQEKFVSSSTASQYPLRFQGIVSDYVDPLIMFSAYRKIGHNLHFSPSDELIDKYENLYLNAENSKTFEQRLKSVRELNTYSKDIVLNVPIAEEKMIYYINRKTVKSLGKQVNPLTINIQNIEVN